MSVHSADVGAAAVPQERSGARLWYMAVVLCLTNTVAFIDRSSMPLLVQQIERDLNITDTQMSFLIGLAFILVYSGLGVPAGMLVDRFSRRGVMSSGILLWATSTTLCGFVTTYPALFAARMGIGMGESVTGPGAMSLVRDAFSPAQRGRAVAIWAMGANIGAGVALLAGGAILHAIGDAPSVTVPILGTIRSWQLVLICCGLMAFPVAALVWTFPEPVRTGRTAASSPSGTSLGEALRYMGARWPIFVPLFLVNGMAIIMFVGQGLWYPVMLQRVWNLSRPEIGFILGIMSLLLGTGSQFSAGIVMDRLQKAGVRTPIPLLGIVIGLLILVPGIMTPLAPSITWAWISLGLYLFIGTSTFTIGTALVTRLTPSSMAGKITSIHFLWVGMVGTAVGATLFASVSDYVFASAGKMAIAYSMSTVTGTLCTLAIITYAVILVIMRRNPEYDAHQS